MAPQRLSKNKTKMAHIHIHIHTHRHEETHCLAQKRKAEKGKMANEQRTPTQLQTVSMPVAFKIVYLWSHRPPFANIPSSSHRVTRVCVWVYHLSFMSGDGEFRISKKVCQAYAYYIVVRTCAQCAARGFSILSSANFAPFGIHMENAKQRRPSWCLCFFLSFASFASALASLVSFSCTLSKLPFMFSPVILFRGFCSAADWVMR